VLIAARDAGVLKVVYSGSSTYYGNRPAPQIEDLPHDCLNFYSMSKYVGEQYCLLFDRLYDLPIVILRYFNVYGPRQPEAGPYALVLGIFLRQWRDGQPLTIHGTGAQRRDFVHVRDVVAATIRAFEVNVRKQALNVGSGTNISIKDLADMITHNQVFGPRREGDAEVTLGDLTRTRACLGWEPMVRFEDGLRELKGLARQGLLE
jgi:UDP-glucose 4-epimerase